MTSATGLTASQLDEEREARLQRLKQEGWQRRRPWHGFGVGSDIPLMVREHRWADGWRLAQGVRSSLVDHAYRLERITSGVREIVFVTEPYADLHQLELDPSLARLREEGWVVELHPELALHFPGQTIAVHIRLPLGNVQELAALQGRLDEFEHDFRQDQDALSWGGGLIALRDWFEEIKEPLHRAYILVRLQRSSRIKSATKHVRSLAEWEKYAHLLPVAEYWREVLHPRKSSSRGGQS